MTPTPKEGPPTLHELKTWAEDKDIPSLADDAFGAAMRKASQYAKIIIKLHKSLERDEKRRAAWERLEKAYRKRRKVFFQGGKLETLDEAESEMVGALSDLDALTPTQEKE